MKMRWFTKEEALKLQDDLLSLSMEVTDIENGRRDDLDMKIFEVWSLLENIVNDEKTTWKKEVI